ncbi:MAG: GTPase ObgE [Myxococcota bacterium]|nr:GTPase ObgE [Myxococcota bacterium]
MSYSFVDEATILVRSGNGGQGCVSFRREKHVEFGGPDGGNGGRGGDVVLRVDDQLATLLDYRYRRKHFASNGAPGEGNQCSGKDGEAALLKLPVGTVVYNAETDEQLVDLCSAGQEFTVARGGRGGKGNAHFKSSTRQAPRYSQPGEPGAELSLRFELKLLADVGLVGMPSVGKSSLIARISAARPKIADYPFTTLSPNLGVVKFGITDHFVVADVPGLITGAHQGAGLGAQFLRHVERVRRIAHLVTVCPEEPGRDPIEDFEAIERELILHDENLKDVERVMVLNRMDLPDVQDAEERVAAYAKEHGMPFFAVSAVTGHGIEPLINHLGHVISNERADQAKASEEKAKQPSLEQLPPDPWGKYAE